MKDIILYITTGVIALYIVGSWIYNWYNLNKK